jgi:cytochrome c553
MIAGSSRVALLVWLSVAVLPAAHADDATTRDLAATCTGCHGTNGVSAGAIPTIAGLEKERIVVLMKEFKDGKRTATIMQQHAKGYTDEQIDAIAGWFASQKR